MRRLPLRAAYVTSASAGGYAGDSGYALGLRLRLNSRLSRGLSHPAHRAGQRVIRKAAFHNLDRRLGVALRSRRRPLRITRRLEIRAQVHPQPQPEDLLEQESHLLDNSLIARGPRPLLLREPAD